MDRTHSGLNDGSHREEHTISSKALQQEWGLQQKQQHKNNANPNNNSFTTAPTRTTTTKNKKQVCVFFQHKVRRGNLYVFKQKGIRASLHMTVRARCTSQAKPLKCLSSCTFPRAHHNPVRISTTGSCYKLLHSPTDRCKWPQMITNRLRLPATDHCAPPRTTAINQRSRRCEFQKIIAKHQIKSQRRSPQNQRESLVGLYHCKRPF